MLFESVCYFIRCTFEYKSSRETKIHDLGDLSYVIFKLIDSPMFIAILVLFGGFLSSLRSRSLQRLSFPATKFEL